MEYYRMSAKLEDDSALLFEESDDDIVFKTGNLIKNYKGPLVCTLDEENPNGIMPTFFESPAFICTKKFHRDLTAAGVDNVQAFPCLIKDTVNGREIKDYVFINIVGRVACADMGRSEANSLSDDAGDDMTIIDDLVIDPARTHDLEFFVVDEDTDCMVVSERIYKQLTKKKYADIIFEQLQQVP